MNYVMWINLKKVREGAGLSQEALARKIGRSLFVIQKYEQQKSLHVNLEILESLCKALDCSPGDILLLEKSKDEA